MSDPTRAQRASSFGSRAAEYAEHRPDYPREAIEWGLSGADGTPRRVLDLGAGTGKLTLGLAALGLDVTAVEPDPEMRAELERLVPTARSSAGRAERIPLLDAEVDAVFAGQAFHWFDVPAAMTEIGRVLRPGGKLASSYYLINDDSLAALKNGKTDLTLYPGDRYWTNNPNIPEDLTALDEAWLRGAYAAAGLTIETVLRGAWTGAKVDPGLISMNRQDIIVARAAA